ncbi:hypothetical protein ZIOFF_014374 [Zingiber officinale]|uniref:Retroviral polymerase SH3-like domain-containing protein n=1 Tax=Zingiber officinale TaxID=94328 RepID=A0A8J5HE64_ZINOF|nr:hypothetical protein ZIOFF_014374 [Zingiber officinale]
MVERASRGDFASQRWPVPRTLNRSDVGGAGDGEPCGGNDPQPLHSAAAENPRTKSPVRGAMEKIREGRGAAVILMVPPVMAMARSLLKGTHMPARFWGEAVRHAVYLLNRLPTKALGERTPFEAWMGRKPHLAHLKVFGCIAYAKNTTPHLKKLDDRSSPIVYLGVEEGCKAHRLFDPRHNKLQVSRDVIFQENIEWTWNAGADKEDLPEFVVVNAFNTDEVIVTADIEAAAEDVTPSSSLATPSSTRASSPSTPSSSTQELPHPSLMKGQSVIGPLPISMPTLRK